VRCGRRAVGCSGELPGDEVTLDDASTVRADAVVVAVGRAPDTADLALETLGVSLDGRGHIAVDARGHIGVGDLYAAGDAVATPRLTPVAYAEGVAAVEAALDGVRLVDPALVPRVLYTTPPAASVGA
jgi:dihydrolipoamide dehydrogenase